MESILIFHLKAFTKLHTSYINFYFLNRIHTLETFLKMELIPNSDHKILHVNSHKKIISTFVYEI